MRIRVGIRGASYKWVAYFENRCLDVYFQSEILSVSQNFWLTVASPKRVFVYICISLEDLYSFSSKITLSQL